MTIASRWGALAVMAISTSVNAGDPVKVGVVGLDTSHAGAFTTIINNPKAKEPIAGFRVVAAFPGGSRDIPSSWDRVAGYTKEMKEKHGVEIVDSIPALLSKVDVVLLESVDGRPHLEQARPVFEARKPVFIDKPLAGSLADAVAIYSLAEKSGTPMFSSSALRFSKGIHTAKTDAKFGGVVGCEAFSPCEIDPHHPDLFWYGIHGVETLYTIMGPGCETVVRSSTKGTDLATGVWKDGRIGVFRGIREGKKDFGAFVFGAKAVGSAGGFTGYDPLVAEICTFFRTRRPPVSAEETLELYAFMEAADESKRQGGAPVKIADVLAKARAAGK